MILVELETALQRFSCLTTAMSWLVWPVSLTTLMVNGWRCYKERRLLQVLPLLATQLNSALNWSCVSAYSIGTFAYYINGTVLLKGDHYSLRNSEIPVLLTNLIYLEPLNLFFYTWRFLAELELETSHPLLKKFYKWFADVSIVLLPSAFITAVIGYIVEYGRYTYYIDNFKTKES